MPDSLPPRDTVARVLYASRSTLHGPVYAEMERIRAAALRHNEPLGITTALLHQSGWFVQWKEGPGDAIWRLMGRVATDPRHHGMCIVHASRGPRLLRGAWSMAIVQCPETPDDMASRIEVVLARNAAGRRCSPPATWRLLSTPLQRAVAGATSDPTSYQRVLACAAHGDSAFDLVRWLGQREGRPVLHRRFAGAHDLDVGTDLVDFVHDGHVLRVVAMARRGLQLPLTQAFLADYSHVLLLLYEDTEANLALMRRVLSACHGLRHLPRLVGVHPEPATHVPLVAFARSLGHAYEPAFVRPEDPATCWPGVVDLVPPCADTQDAGDSLGAELAA